MPLPECVRQRWSPLNTAPCPESGVRSTDWAYITYACGCPGYKQLATLRRRPETALRCPEHGGGTWQLSEAAQGMRAAMTSTIPGLGPVVLEAHLLPGSQKPFDFWLPRYGIAVEVDGRQHFRGSMHGETAAARQQRDRRVNALCKKRRLRLVRCHYADRQEWGALMQQAVREVQQNPHCWFVKATHSYRYEGAAV